MHPNSTVESSGKEINKRVAKIAAVLKLFTNPQIESPLESLAINRASKLQDRRNFDINADLLPNLKADHTCAMEKEDSLTRLRTLDQIVSLAEDHPSFNNGLLQDPEPPTPKEGSKPRETSSPRERAEALHELTGILQLADAAQQRDTGDISQQFITLLDGLTIKLQQLDMEQQNLLLKQINDYIKNKIEHKGDKSEIEVCKDCITEINALLSAQYAEELSNLQAALQSYHQYLETLESKSDSPELKQRAQECQQLIDSTKSGLLVDPKTKITNLANGLAKMDAPLEIVSSDNKKTQVTPCSKHQSGIMYSIFNNLLDFIAKKCPEVLKYKKGFSEDSLKLIKDTQKTLKQP